MSAENSGLDNNKVRIRAPGGRLVGLLFIGIFVLVGSGYLLLTHALTQSTLLKAHGVAYVTQNKPNSSNANPVSFYTKGSTDKSGNARRSYLKFVVPKQASNATVTKAILKLYTRTSNSKGFSIRKIASNNWSPSTLTYKNAPTVGVIIGNGSAVANAWASIDVSSYIKSAGTYSIAVWSKDNNLISYSNSGTTAPKLVVQLTSAGDKQAPTNVSVLVPTGGQNVSGLVYFNGSGQDNVGITRYEYFVDGKSVGTANLTASGWTIFDAATQKYGYDSKQLVDGAHAIYSLAIDAAGNRTQSSAVNFTVKNSNPPPPAVVRATFYYPWFPETWGSNIANPFTNYHPVLGYYSSDDSNVISRHISEMTYAGFDAAIASWWGQKQHKEDSRILALLNNSSNSSNGKKLKWALYYEKESVGDPAVSEISGDLSYIKSHYAGNANYLTVNNKPVILVFADGGDGCDMAKRWQDANAGQGFYVVLKVFGNYTGCLYQPDGWHQYGPASATDSQGKYSYAISPGFYQKGESSARLARLDSATWAANIDKMVASQARFQLVTTFNEWGEGTAIEPADNANGWASTSGYGTYIDILHQKLNNGTGVPDTTPPTIPANLTGNAPSGSQVVNLAWVASTDSGGSGLKGYQLYRNNALLTTLTTTTFSDTTVTFGTQYSYLVKAIDNASNLSGASNTVSVTPVAPSDTTSPTTPGSFGASLPVATGKTVHLAWVASTDSGGSGLKNYILARNGTVIATPAANATSFDDTTTIFSTAYTYTIAAVDNAGNTSAAATTSITTPTAPADTQAPDVPTTTATVVSPTQVTISWSTVSDNPKSGATAASGVKGYKVFRAGTQVADVIAPSNSTNDGPFNFVSGQSYNYTVLAYDVAGNSSAQSAASSVIPNPTVVVGANCGNTSTGNKIDTIIVISEENRTWSNVGGPGFSASSMPYTNALAAKCGFFQLDTEVNTSDNSAQQYVGGWTGFGATTTNVSADCSPSASCSYTGNNIFRAFRSASIPHREYVEGATGTCSASGNAAKHIPDLYMWDPTDKANCTNEVLPMSQFNFASPPTGYTFITPTLCNDGHDCSDNTVDSWLSSPSRLPALFNSTAYKSGKVLVELWYDEDHPKPNLFACWSCKQFNSAIDPHFSGESLLWLNLLGAPSSNLGAISSATDIRPIVGTP